MGSFGNGGGRSSDDVSGVGFSPTEHRGPGTLQRGVVVNENSSVVEVSSDIEEDVTAQQGVGLGKESSGLDELAAQTASQGKASYASVTARTGGLRDANACNPRKEDVVKMEYEGLQQICFKCGVYGHAKESCDSLKEQGGQGKCFETNLVSLMLLGPKVDDLFGPWMVVADRRRKSWSKGASSSGPGKSGELPRGSRFAALVDVDGDVLGEKGTLVGSDMVHLGATLPMTNSKIVGLNSSTTGPVPTKVNSKNASSIASNPGKKSKVSGVLASSVPAVSVVPLVDNVEAEVVEHVVGTGSGSHTAISINESGYEGQGRSGGKVVKARGSLSRAAKKNAKWGFKVRKPAKMRNPTCLVLSEWATNMSLNLVPLEGGGQLSIEGHDDDGMPSLGDNVLEANVGERMVDPSTSADL
ncbi:hypothetical protein V6N11_069349 [Hibiscus sabdariffa]|uniref:CCHC-type domain-containing protein n=1 Tax=Hibiscus sabdariffa TaxID=183260 RepID=A0ABR1ZJQ0_9ROSI